MDGSGFRHRFWARILVTIQKKSEPTESTKQMVPDLFLGGKVADESG